MSMMDSFRKRNLHGWVFVPAFVVLLFCSVPTAFGQQAAIVRREAMGRIFFDPVQRSVLESVRQGVVDRTINPTEFEEIQTTSIEVPRIVFREVAVVKDESTGVIARENDFTFSGLIRMRGGETKLLLDGLITDTEELAVLEENAGLVIDVETDAESGTAEIPVEDRLFGKRYLLRRGDSVSASGAVYQPSDNNPRRRFFVVKRSD